MGNKKKDKKEEYVDLEQTNVVKFKKEELIPFEVDEDGKPIPFKATNVQVRACVNKVAELLMQNKTTPEICEIIRVQTGKSDQQIKRYVQKATELLQKDFDRDVNTKRLEMVSSLRRDSETAYKMFLSTDDVKWFQEYQKIKERLVKFEPNELKSEPIQEEKSVTEYNFNFKTISKEDLKE